MPGSINIYGKSAVGITLLDKKYLSKSKILLRQAFTRRAEKIEIEKWRKFEGQYSDIGYTLIHGQDGIGAACYTNNSKDKKVKIKFDIDGENITECKFLESLNFDNFLDPMKEGNNKKPATKDLNKSKSTFKSFSDFKNPSLTKSGFKNSKKTLQNSQIDEEDADQDSKAKISNKLMYLEPG